jgi:ubiquitin-activating enzyme E1
MQHQWFLYLRDELFDPETAKTAVFDLLPKLKFAVIGVGATGCEVAKLLALCGASSITLVDGDHIETTNLNRQVLFADSDVGKNKAAAAAETLRKVRPDAEFIVYEHFIGKESENLFDDKWFAQFNAVFAMVDSFGARGEIDRRCAPVRVPMFTGGIDRICADWQSIIPDVTPRYVVPGSFSSPSSDEALSCTLKLFPNRPEHCIEWAAHQLQRVLHRPCEFKTFAECVSAAVELFEGKFVLKIKDLQYVHPKGEVVDGVYYWSQHRIFPTEVAFDVANPYLRQFVTATARLLGTKSGLVAEEIDYTQLAPETEWKPPDAERRRQFTEDPAPSRNPEDNHFDYDNEVQLDFLEAASNLRSANYGLGAIDRFLAQKIAGRIESAVSTTASVCAAGLLTAFLVSTVSPSAERGKFVVSPFSVASYRQLATPFRKFGNTDELFSPWDFIRFEGDEKLADAQRVIETRANRRMACWATTDGMMIAGGLFGQKTGDLTFNQVFEGQWKIIELEFSLELEGDREFLLPPIRVHLTASFVPSVIEGRLFRGSGRPADARYARNLRTCDASTFIKVLNALHVRQEIEVSHKAHRFSHLRTSY